MRCSSCKFKTIYFISNLFRSAIWFYGFDFNSRFYTWCLPLSYDWHSNIYYKELNYGILCSKYLIFVWCYNRHIVRILITFIKFTLKCFLVWRWGRGNEWQWVFKGWGLTWCPLKSTPNRCWSRNFGKTKAAGNWFLIVHIQRDKRWLWRCQNFIFSIDLKL